MINVDFLFEKSIEYVGYGLMEMEIKPLPMSILLFQQDILSRYEFMRRHFDETSRFVPSVDDHRFFSVGIYYCAHYTSWLFRETKEKLTLPSENRLSLIEERDIYGKWRNASSSLGFSVTEKRSQCVVSSFNKELEPPVEKNMYLIRQEKKYVLEQMSEELEALKQMHHHFLECCESFYQERNPIQAFVGSSLWSSSSAPCYPFSWFASSEKGKV